MKDERFNTDEGTNIPYKKEESLMVASIEKVVCHDKTSPDVVIPIMTSILIAIYTMSVYYGILGAIVAIPVVIIAKIIIKLFIRNFDILINKFVNTPV